MWDKNIIIRKRERPEYGITGRILEKFLRYYGKNYYRSGYIMAENDSDTPGPEELGNDWGGEETEEDGGLENKSPKPGKIKDFGGRTFKTNVDKIEHADFELIDDSDMINRPYKWLIAKHLDKKGDIYRIQFKGASHSFLNHLVARLLKEEGVNFAAYKLTSLEPPVLTVVTDGTRPLKEILRSAAEAMREEIRELRKVINESVME